MSDFDKWHQPVRFTDVGLGIRDAEVCMTCHTVLDEPDDWPEDGPEWPYPNIQVPWPCAAYQEVAHLRGIENRVIELLDSADADVAQELYYGHHLEWDENCAEDGEYWIYPGGKPQVRPVP